MNHETHCFQDEYKRSCKYGDYYGCPMKPDKPVGWISHYDMWLILHNACGDDISRLITEKMTDDIIERLHIHLVSSDD